MCETLNRLKAVGGINRNATCPWISQCEQNLAPEKCEVVQTVAALDPSNRKPVKIISLDWQGQNPKQES